MSNQTVEVTRVTGLVETGEFVQFVNRRNQNNRMVTMVQVKFVYPSLDGDFVTKELFKRSEVRFIK